MAKGIGARAKAWWRARLRTDEQYVERIRKKQRSMRKARIVLLCLLAATMVVWLSAGNTIYAIGKIVTVSEMDALFFAAGLATGTLLGFFVYAIFSSIPLILFGERSDELMLKFYDELKNREQGFPAADGSADL